jgi:hypothetical protein
VQECIISGCHGYLAYLCYDRAFVNDVAASVSMPMGLPCLPWVHGNQGATVSVCDCVTP